MGGGRASLAAGCDTRLTETSFLAGGLHLVHRPLLCPGNCDDGDWDCHCHRAVLQIRECLGRAGVSEPSGQGRLFCRTSEAGPQAPGQALAPRTLDWPAAAPMLRPIL